MPFSPLSWFAAGDFIWSNSAARNTLICCALLIALTCIPWLRWISNVQHHLRQGELLGDDDANHNVEPTERGEDYNSASGDRVKMLVSKDSDSNPSDPNTPPQAEDGLQILHECRDAAVDIVAVHGLGANPTYAWVWLPKNNPDGEPGYPDKPFNWLKDLLPTKLSCQVMAFNYDSKWFSKAPQQHLSNISDRLLDSLRNQRKNASGRPIVFVGHSFGGNIIEQAIVSAYRHPSEDLRTISESTVGVVFLGTPHRGSRAATWGGLIASLAPPGFVTEDRLLRALEERSDSLTDRLHEFSRWLFSESVPAVCGFELLPTDYSSRIGMIANILPHKELVVPESSACIDGHHKISLHTDHFKINKFYGSDDPSFKLIYSEIERMTQHAEETLKRRRKPIKIPTDQGAISGDLRKCLQKMGVNNPMYVLSAVKDQKGERVGSTCEWILKREEFSAWAASEGPQLLRLIGSPGIGKTMMSTFLVEELKEKVERSPGKVFAFFFCDDKDQDRKTPTAILRSLVWQLLLQRNELFQHIQPDFEKHTDDRVFEGLFDNLSALWIIFQRMLRDDRAGEVFILVDALDECEISTRKALLRHIKKLFRSLPTAEAGKLKLLVTSRPEISDIERELKDVGVSLRMDVGNINNDLSEYIDNRVDDLASTNEYSPGLKKVVSDALHSQAGGTFLWVSLMLEVLRETPRDKVKQELDNLPAGLDQTYARILSENDSDDKQKRARFLLLSMVAARRPLKKIEIAAAFALWEYSLVLQQEELHDYTDIFSSCSSIIYFKAAENDYNTTVTFCHQSVKDFLLHDQISSDRAWYHTSRDRADLLMLEVCWGYLSSDVFDNGSLVIRRENGALYKAYRSDLKSHFQKHPLLEYAFSKWEEHAMGSYPALLCESEINLAKAPTLRDTWLLRAALEGHEAEVKLLLEKGAEVDSKDEGGRTPLSWAAKGRHEAVVKLLLEKGAELDSKDRYIQILLSRAAKQGREAVVKLLLEKGAEVDSKDRYGKTPLSYAAERGYKEVVRLLLEKGAEVDSKDRYGQTPLLWAEERGHEEVVKLLFEKGADPNLKDEGGRTLLLRAVEQGREAVVKLLLEKGADPNLKDNDDQTPLSRAAEGGNEEVVKLLLEKGAEVDSKDEDDQTPLSGAAEGGHKEVVRLLLKNGAEVDSKDEDDQTPLSRAAERGHEEVVKLLLEKGAKLDSKDEGGRTPLSRAAEQGREAVVKLLLEKGAEVDSKDRYGKTPLSRAAEGGHEEVVRLLLKKGAEVDSKDRYGRTPLSRAEERGHEEVVKLLLEKGAEVDSKDEGGRTLLSRAAEQGREAVVKLLLEKGADPNLKDNNSQTPLSRAAEGGYEEVVKLLTPEP